MKQLNDGKKLLVIWVIHDLIVFILGIALGIYGIYSAIYQSFK